MAALDPKLPQAKTWLNLLGALGDYWSALERF